MKKKTPAKAKKVQAVKWNDAKDEGQETPSLDGITLHVGGDVWTLIEGVEDLFAIGRDDVSLGDSVESDELIVVVPNTLQIITNGSFSHAAFGTAILHAIAISMDSL